MGTVVRPTLLVLETEPDSALSARKLLLESLKFNVTTAHSWEEALALFDKFPNVDALIVADNVKNWKRVTSELRSRSRELPIVLLSPNPSQANGEINTVLPSHEPELLVDHMRDLFGDPRNVPAQQT